MKPRQLIGVGIILLTLALVLFIGARNGDFPASMQAITRIPVGYALATSAQPLQTSTFSQANQMEAGWEEEGHCPPPPHTHAGSDNLARWVSAPSQRAANAFSHYYYHRSTRRWSTC